MAKVVIRSTDSTPYSALPSFKGLTRNGEVATKAVIDGNDRPLLLWQHDLPEGSGMEWDEPEGDHLFYVRHGQIDANGATLGREDSLIVERDAKLALNAKAGPASLLHFHSVKHAVRSPGGHVHILRRREQATHFHPQAAMTIYADSSCPTCDLWLHSVEIPAALDVFVEEPHFHSQDELIAIIEGVMTIGPRRIAAGSALAIDANTIYTFGITENALRFINFRAGPSSVTTVSKDGRSAPRDELKMITSLPTSVPASWDKSSQIMVS